MRQGFRVFAILQLLVASVMALIGLFVSVRPYMLLDVVLSPTELRDEATRDKTLALLQRATSSDSTLWLLFAAFIAGLGLYVLRLGVRSA